MTATPSSYISSLLTTATTFDEVMSSSSSKRQKAKGKQHLTATVSANGCDGGAGAAGHSWNKPKLAMKHTHTQHMSASLLFELLLLLLLTQLRLCCYCCWSGSQRRQVAAAAAAKSSHRRLKTLVFTLFHSLSRVSGPVSSQLAKLSDRSQRLQMMVVHHIACSHQVHKIPVVHLISVPPPS